MQTVSVVIPAYNEESNIPLLYQRLHATAAGIEDVQMEFLIMDDASRDSTPDILQALALADNRVRTIRLARNFGSHTAYLAGLHHARGDAMVIMSADLQDPPELIPSLIEQWKAGYEIVWGIRETRSDPLINILQARMFYWLFRKIAIKNFPASDVVLISRRIAKHVVEAREKNTSIFGLIGWLGLPSSQIPYTRAARHSGHSKWTMSKTIKLAVDSFVSFSFFPVRMMSYIGFALSGAGVLLLAFLFIKAAMERALTVDWLWLLSAMLLIGGLQSVMMGILGEYIWRTLDQTRNRPMFIFEDATVETRNKEV